MANFKLAIKLKLFDSILRMKQTFEHSISRKSSSKLLIVSFNNLQQMTEKIQQQIDKALGIFECFNNFTIPKHFQYIFSRF